MINLNSIFITIEYNILKTVILQASPSRQWISVTLLLLVRELNLYIQENLAYKAAGGKDLSVELVASFGINTRHCVFLSTVLGSEITTLSTWIILGSDLTINLFFTLRIIWLKKKNNTSDKEKIESYLESKISGNLSEILHFSWALTSSVWLLQDRCFGFWQESMCFELILVCKKNFGAS